MELIEKQIAHLENLRKDIRDEIKNRIEQRNRYSIQFIISLATILAISLSGKTVNIGDATYYIDLRKVILVAPLISIYFGLLILYSYRIHYILTKYLREKIEPSLAKFHKISRDFEWENYYSLLAIPGIRKKFFFFIPWIITILTSIYMFGISKSNTTDTENIITSCIFIVYFIFLVWFTIVFYSDDKRIEKMSGLRDWPNKVYPKFNQAVFIDRDGTINKDTHYTYRKKDLEFLPGVKIGFKELSKFPLDIIVVSNQAGIALGYYTQKKMSKFNNKLRKEIIKKGGRINAFYFCPHLEKKHLSSDETLCDCSKPMPGMLIEARKDFDLDLENCYLIGNKLTDIEAGKRVKCKTILISQDNSIENKINNENKPNYIVHNFDEAIDVIKSKFKKS